MDLIELEILKMEHGVSYTNSYAVILFEREEKRTLPIIIGEEEARSIAIGLEGIETPRPLTHDLCVNILNEANLNLDYIHIYKIVEGIFHSKLICRNIETGITHEIDSRTSDAIALAVRAESKIYVSNALLDEVGVVYQGEFYEMDEDDLVEPNTQSRSLEDLSITKLHDLMQDMLDKEDYEEAARIRDAIKRKQS